MTGATKKREPETELGEVLDDVEAELGADARHTLEVAIIQKAIGEEDAVTREDLETDAAAAEEGV